MSQPGDSSIEELFSIFPIARQKLVLIVLLPLTGKLSGLQRRSTMCCFCRAPQIGHGHWSETTHPNTEGVTTRLTVLIPRKPEHSPSHHSPVDRFTVVLGLRPLVTSEASTTEVSPVYKIPPTTRPLSIVLQ